MTFTRLVVAGVGGALAGAAGTLAMDLLWYSRYRRGAGNDPFPDWETATGTTSYEGASAPARTGKRMMELLLHREPPEGSARAMTNVVHWSTGCAWGALYGVVEASTGVQPLVGGVALAASAWTSTYVLLPPLGVYQPIWKYDAPTLLKDASAHVTYGMTTATVVAMLRRSR